MFRSKEKIKIEWGLQLHEILERIPPKKVLLLILNEKV